MEMYDPWPKMKSCVICKKDFVFPCYIKYVKYGYAHQSCLRKQQGIWATIKWIFKGCPKW